MVERCRQALHEPHARQHARQHTRQLERESVIVKHSTSHMHANSRGSLLSSSIPRATHTPTRAGVCDSQAIHEQHTRQHERADSHRTACVPASCLRSSCMPGLVSRTRSCSRSALSGRRHVIGLGVARRQSGRFVRPVTTNPRARDQPPEPRSARLACRPRTARLDTACVPLGLRPDRGPHGLRSRLPIDSGRQELRAGSSTTHGKPLRVITAVGNLTVPK